MRVQLDSGEVIDLGTTATAPTIGIIDYSRRVTDDYGVTTVVERGFARRMSVQVAVPFETVDVVQRRLADLRATSALFIADERFASLSVRGFYKEFSIDLASPPLSYCTLSVEGLADGAGAADPGGDPSPDGQPSTLQLVQPATVGTAQLIATSVAENDAPEWSSTAAYPRGIRVIKAATHRIYESLAAIVAGDDPAAASGKWLDVGPTNRWAMFDQALGSITSANGAIVVTLDVGGVDAVALLDIDADIVRVQASGYDRTQSSGMGTITFLDLPGAAGQVTVTITGSGPVSVGTLLIGHRVSLGLTEASPTAGITDFSRKVVDDFGEVTIVQRAYAKRMTANALIRSDAVDVVANRLAAVRARPSLWIGQAGLDSLTIYGFFKEFSIEIGETVSKLSLSIEGLSTAGKVAPLGALVEWPDIADPVGTKPADHADVTGDNTSKDTHAVYGRTAADIVASLDVNVTSIIEQALRQDDFLQVVQAWSFVQGQPVSAAFLSFKNSQTDANAGFASASDFNSVFAKASNGTGYTMNLQTVKAGNATFADLFSGYNTSIAGLSDTTGSLDTRLGTLSQNLSQTSALAGSVNSKVTALQQAFATDGGGYSKFLLSAQVDANGKTYVAGVSGSAGNTTSELNFVAENFNFVRANGGNPLKLLSYNGDLNRWEFTVDVYAKRIVAGAIDFEFNAANQQLDPNGGFQKLPGGFIIQWGRYRQTISAEISLSIVFPMVFPTGVMAVTATPYITGVNNLKDLWIQNVGAASANGATFFTQAARSDAQSLDGFDWMAFGR